MFWRDNGAAKWFNREEKLRILGDPLTLAVKCAHKHELEIYGYIKPYDWGLSWTYPEGSPLAERYGTLQRIGGRMPQVTRFLRKYPNMRIKRNMTKNKQNQRIFLALLIYSIALTYLSFTSSNVTPNNSDPFIFYFSPSYIRYGCHTLKSHLLFEQ